MGESVTKNAPAKRKFVSPNRDKQKQNHIGIVVDKRESELNREVSRRILDLEVVHGRNESIPREKDAHSEQEEEHPCQVVL